jgi:hypothetical protein
MGGFGSGRYGGQPTVESGLTLDINRLLRQRNIVPGGYRAGSLIWSKVATGEKLATIGYEASLLDPDDAWVRLRYSANGDPQDYRVRLATSSCHFGGRRWWWRCPSSGRRVAKLYLPPGAKKFAARAVYRLAHRSQRGTALDRSHDRQAKLYRKLGADYRVFEQPPPPRPKGMHRKTYARLTGQLYAEMEAHDWLFALGMAPILARLTARDAARRHLEGETGRCGRA